MLLTTLHEFTRTGGVGNGQTLALDGSWLRGCPMDLNEHGGWRVFHKGS